MEYAAEIFIEENGEKLFRLYEGQQPEGAFALFHYNVGDLLAAAMNVANNRDAYKAEKLFKLEKLLNTTPSEWSDDDLEFINFAALIEVLEGMPEQRLSVFESTPPVLPSNPWERGEYGLDVHLSFDRQTRATILSFKTVFSAIMYDGYEARKYKVKPTKCQNCGKLFFPHSRSDEIYCNYIFKNGKTCKELGYEMKVAADQIMKEYRRIYKMQNARKLRNQQKRNIAACFDEWTAFAKQKLKVCQNGEITLDEMKQQISGTDWMP